MSPLTESTRLTLAKSSYPDIRNGIVTNGLVLNLDAAQTASYPGTGTTWTDLSGNGNNGTLVNGPTYSSANGGSIVFDGTNDIVNCGNQSSINITGTGITLSAFVYRTVANGAVVYARIIEKAATYPQLQYSLVTTGANDPVGEGRLLFDLYIGSSLSASLKGITRLELNTWYSVIATYDGSFKRLYLNGNLEGQLAVTGSITSTASSLVLGDYLAAGGNAFKGNIAQASLYNRALTAAEIQQNFNCLRMRYGL